jgi:hypothetical protein
MHDDPAFSNLDNMEIPDEPYVALYGSHPGGWREKCVKLLSDNKIAWYDPTDERWDNISDQNGDRMQAVIDRLVAKEQQGLLRASCVVFHLAHRNSHGGTSREHTREAVGDTQQFPAARCELGFLIGSGIRAFVHIGSDVEGRNYLWAAMKISPLMFRCGSLVEATNKAIRYMQHSSGLTSR